MNLIYFLLRAVKSAFKEPAYKELPVMKNWLVHFFTKIGL